MNAQREFWTERQRQLGAPEETDDALVMRVATGDQAAWRRLVDRHLSALVSQAWYVLGDRSEAEDVAQETFVRLMQKAHDWQPGGPQLKSWLYRVALNLCIDRKRSRWRPRPLDDAAERSTHDDPAGQHAHDSDIARAVKSALDVLTERQRTAIVLVHYQGFTNYEAAEMLGTSVDALESLLARARRAMRGVLAAAAPELLGEV